MNECGVSKDMTLCMMARLRGGADPPSQRGTASGGADQWFYVASQLGVCYAIRTWCFRCGLFRQESEEVMIGSAPSSWPLPPGPVRDRRQPRHVPHGETHNPALQHFVLRGAKGNKQPNPGASVQIQQLVEMLSQIGCSSEVMTEVRNRVSGFASPGDSAEDKQRWLGDLLDRQGRAQSNLTPS